MPAAGPAPQPPAAGRLTAECPSELAEVPAAEWDALIGPGSLPLKHGYLRAWEHSELAGLQSRPVLAYGADPERPVAACPGYLYDLDLPTVQWPQAVPAMQAIRHLIPRFLIARTYELGSPTPLTNPFLVADPALRPDAVQALIDRGLREAAEQKASFVVVQNFTSRNGPAGEVLGGHGFAAVPAPTTAVVDLPYSSFDEYVDAMRAQYRRRAQKTLKRSESLTVEHRQQFADEAEELARLWRTVYDRAGEVKREILTADFFRGASELPEASVLLMRRPDRSIASFGLLMDDRPWLSFMQCGFEDEAGRTEGAYFRLLYEIVRLAIEQGYKQVDLGITTLTPKLDVGAVPVPLFAWVRHGNPLFQRGLCALAKGPLKPDDMQPRKVFKEPPATAEEIVRRRGLIV